MKKLIAMLAVILLYPLGPISESISDAALAIAKWHLKSVATLFLWARGKEDEEIEV